MMNSITSWHLLILLFRQSLKVTVRCFASLKKRGNACNRTSHLKIAAVLRSCLVIFVLLTCAGRALSASAITSDGSVVGGRVVGTTISQGGPIFDITGGTREGRNLFHSFGLFSVGAGDTANFFNDSVRATSNIIGRVTGGQTSNIFGTIKTTNFGNAGLFLINPAGWLFGPTASLDVGGSFHVSTADYLKFADGAKFHADLAKQSALTTAAVSAFGFLSQSPAGITVHGGFLEVPEGETLSLVGGDLSIGEPFFGATFFAAAGKIQLASVASAGEVPTNIQNMNATDFQRLGEINITSASLSASGDIDLHAGQITLANGASIEATSTGLARAGNVLMQANDNLAIRNATVTTDSQSAQGGQIALSGGNIVEITAESERRESR